MLIIGLSPPVHRKTGRCKAQKAAVWGPKGRKTRPKAEAGWHSCGRGSQPLPPAGDLEERCKLPQRGPERKLNFAKIWMQMKPSVDTYFTQFSATILPYFCISNCNHARDLFICVYRYNITSLVQLKLLGGNSSNFLPFSDFLCSSVSVVVYRPTCMPIGPIITGGYKIQWGDGPKRPTKFLVFCKKQDFQQIDRLLGLW